MGLEELSYLSQIAGAFAVVASLLFIGWQVRYYTAALQRAENNATHQQFQAVRLLVIGNEEISRIWVEGLEQGKALGPVERLRLTHLVSDIVWCMVQVWDRSRNRIVDRNEFTRGSLPFLMEILRTPFGSQWWQVGKHGLPPGFWREVDAMLASATPDGDVAASAA